MLLIMNSYAKPYGEHLIQLLSPETLAHVIVEVQGKPLTLSPQQQSQLLPIFSQMIEKVRMEEVPYTSVLIQQHTQIDSIKDMHLPQPQQQLQLKAIRENYKEQLQGYYFAVINIQNDVEAQVKTILTPAQIMLWQSAHKEKIWYQSLIQG